MPPYKVAIAPVFCQDRYLQEGDTLESPDDDVLVLDGTIVLVESEPKAKLKATPAKEG